MRRTVDCCKFWGTEEKDLKVEWVGKVFAEIKEYR
jgi:hypothetical protein